MKTAYLFPGLNGLLREKDRNRFLSLPEVQARFKQAEKALLSQLQLSVDFNQLLASGLDNIYAIHNISLAAIAIVCIQCGVSDRLKAEFAAPDWVMGCSLGDLARSIYADSYDFEDAILNHLRFTRDISGINEIGKNIGVATPAGHTFTAEDFAWFESINVDVSHMTPRFLNIGGRFAELDLIIQRAKMVGWKTMTILDYPAHSRYILPFVEKVQSKVLEVNIHPPRLPMFSSFSAKPLTDPEEIKREFILSITKTIHWDLAVTRLVKEHQVTRFVNIGPCASLSNLMRDIPVEVEMVEAHQLLGITP